VHETIRTELRDMPSDCTGLLGLEAFRGTWQKRNHPDWTEVTDGCRMADLLLALHKMVAGLGPPESAEAAPPKGE
jgi:hypothetical protein